MVSKFHGGKWGLITPPYRCAFMDSSENWANLYYVLHNGSI